MPKRSDHIHKYKRIQLGRNRTYVVWRCQVSDCSHYIPRELVVGRQTICWRCGKSFTMTQAILDLSKPHCFECTRPVKGKENDTINVTDIDIDALLKDIG